MRLPRRSSTFRPAFLVSAGLMAVAMSPACAQALPKYDPATYCQEVADTAGGSAMIFNGCIELEQEAYDRLKPAWSSMPEKTRRYCDEVARTAHGAYSILSGCIDMEMEAAGSKKNFRF